MLRVDMEDFDGIRKFATYSNFFVAGQDDKYRLTVGGYSGNAGRKLIIFLLRFYIHCMKKSVSVDWKINKALWKLKFQRGFSVVSVAE